MTRAGAYTEYMQDTWLQREQLNTEDIDKEANKRKHMSSPCSDCLSLPPTHVSIYPPFTAATDFLYCAPNSIQPLNITSVSAAPGQMIFLSLTLSSIQDFPGGTKLC